MLVDDPGAFVAALAALPPGPVAPATASEVLLVAPHGFRLADESGLDNRYMRLDEPVSEAKALATRQPRTASFPTTSSAVPPGG